MNGMDEQSVEDMKDSGRVKLGFWQGFVHYGLSVLLLLPGLFVIDRVDFTGTHHDHNHVSLHWFLG